MQFAIRSQRVVALLFLLNENGELIGVEILNASAFIQDTILDANFAEGLAFVGGTNKSNQGAF